MQARDPAFTIGERNLPAIAEVCRRLDGLPLAIELAAGRVGLLSVSELATRLRSGLEALDAGPRDAPGRHRTLTAALEWSYALLNAQEQRVFVAFAVFAGGCTLDAAIAVTGAPVGVLEGLVAKNLVVAEAMADGKPRLTMLETIRTYARAQLEQRRDSEAVAARHCKCFLALAERLQPELERTGSRTLVAELDRDLDNMRGAFAWALEHAPELALRIATATAAYWFLAPRKSEATDWLRTALALRDEVEPVAARAAALQYYAVNLARQGAVVQAESAARDSLALRRSLADPSGCSRSASALAYVLMLANQVPDAYALAAEALRLADSANDQQARVWALATMASAAPTVREALCLGAQAAAAHRVAGNSRELAGLQSGLVYTALIHGECEAAEPLSLEGLAAARADGDPFVIALAEGNAGLAALLNGRLDAAQLAFASELRLAIGHGLDTDYTALRHEALDGLAAVAAAHGRDRTAATLRGAAAAIASHHSPAIAQRLNERFFAAASARLGEQAWHAAYAEGATLNTEQATELALRSVQPGAVA